MKRHLFFILTVLFLFSACLNDSAEKNSDKVNREIAQLEVTWEVVANGVNKQSQFLSVFELINQGNSLMTNKGWTIYFSQIMGGGPPLEVRGPVTVEHISGDFFSMKPTEEFEDLKKDESVKIETLWNTWAIKKTDGPSGMYIVYENEEGVKSDPFFIKNLKIKDFKDPIQINRNDTDTYPIPTPEYVYKENEKVSKLNEKEFQAILPKPLRYTALAGKMNIDANTIISFPKELEKEANFLQSAIEKSLGKKVPVSNEIEKGEGTIRLAISPEKFGGSSGEGYQLNISSSNGILLEGASAAGVFYGIQSLKALLPVVKDSEFPSALSVQEATVFDAPRFEYRGMHLDVARNFQSKKSVLKLLDLMAFYKMNKFHFHLTDDEGWRLEIKDLPELTEVGARRGHTLDESDRLRPAWGSGPYMEYPGTGHYTKEDFIEILKFANDRHIEVIPEIDMPGHARAAIKSMDARYKKYMEDGNEAAAVKYLLRDLNDKSEYLSVQSYNDNVISVCQESTYAFLEKVVDEIIALFAEANAPLTTIHIGADEVPHGAWMGSAECTKLAESTSINLTTEVDRFQYFLKRFSDILQKKKLITGGWEEIAMLKESSQGNTVLKANPTFVNSNFLPYVWNAVFGWGGEDLAYKLANAGYPIVMCNASNLYFDFAYNKDPDERGLYWAGFTDTRKPFELAPFDLFKSANIGRYGAQLDPDKLAEGKTKLTQEGRNNILGIQGQLWSETVKAPEHLEYYIFPKILGLAERAWATPAQWETEENKSSREKSLAADWNKFANAVGQKEMPRLDVMNDGVNYRVPQPGAIIKNGLLYANTAYPGLEIRYSTDDGQIGKVYDPNKPVPVKDKVHLIATSKNGHSSRILTISAEDFKK